MKRSTKRRKKRGYRWNARRQSFGARFIGTFLDEQPHTTDGRIVGANRLHPGEAERFLTDMSRSSTELYSA